MSAVLWVATIGGWIVGAFAGSLVWARIQRRRNRRTRLEVWPGVAVLLIPGESRTAWAVEVNGKVTDRGSEDHRSWAEQEAMMAAASHLEVLDVQAELRRNGMAR